jgi:hypothetical protein
MPEVRESVEPSSSAGKFGVGASGEDAGVSASQSVLAPSGLVLLGNRGDLIESGAFSAITSGASWLCPLGLADPRSTKIPTVFSPLTLFLLFSTKH